MTGGWGHDPNRPRTTPTAVAAVWAVGVLVGVVVGGPTSDVIVEVIAGVAGVVIGNGLLRLWTGVAAPRGRPGYRDNCRDDPTALLGGFCHRGGTGATRGMGEGNEDLRHRRGRAG